MNPQDILFGFLCGVAAGAYLSAERAAAREKERDKKTIVIGSTEKTLAIFTTKDDLNSFDLVGIERREKQ